MIYTRDKNMQKHEVKAALLDAVLSCKCDNGDMYSVAER